MKFVATKTADKLDWQPLPGARAVCRSAHRLHQLDPRLLLERGITVRQGLRFLRAELPGILAKETDALSPRMSHILEDLSAERRLPRALRACPARSKRWLVKTNAASD